jgi:hypothetical protein
MKPTGGLAGACDSIPTQQGVEFRDAKLLKQNAQRFATLATNARYFVYYSPWRLFLQPP